MSLNNSLMEKLEAIRRRFEEIGTQITDPEVINDTKRYIKLNKEYKEVEDLVAVSKEYKNLIENLNNTKLLLKEEKDEEMREMARGELEEMEEKVPEMEEEIKILLLPSDPEDGKNAVMEIRSGTGADEAIIYAGDMFRMYTIFC
jgi:peptide chain release factor 1